MSRGVAVNSMIADRIDPRLHFARQAGDGVVRLVHDHQRPVDMHQVGEGEFHATAFQLFQPRRLLGSAVKCGSMFSLWE